MQKLSIAVATLAFIVLETTSSKSVQAALLDVDFSTTAGATGSFTLDTNTPPSPEPAIFQPGITGIAYSGAVSNFSISAPYVNLSNITTDFEVIPSFTADSIGLPANLGVLSGVSYPSGCITSPGFTCSINVGLLYSGNQTELPTLSDNPLSYSTGLAVEVFSPTNGLPSRDNITSLRVVSRQVPESNSGLSILALSVVTLGLMIKRRASY